MTPKKDEAARAESLRRDGDAAGARAHAFDALKRVRDDLARGALLAALARACLDLGDVAEATRSLERAAKCVAQDPVLAAEVELDLARVRRAQGDVEGALRSLASAADRFRKTGRSDGERRALAERGEVLAAQGEWKSARGAFRAAVELRGDEPPDEPLRAAIARTYEAERKTTEPASDERALSALIARAAPTPGVPVSDPGPARAGQDADALARVVESLGRDDMVRLVSLAGALGAEISPQPLLELILDRAIEWTGAARGLVAFADSLAPDGSPWPSVHAARALRGPWMNPGGAWRELVRESLARSAPFVSGDAALDARLLGATQPAGSFACCPLVVRRAPLGAILLVSDRRGAFAARERALLEAIAAHAALALDRAFHVERLEDEWRASRRELDEERGALVGRSRSMRNLLRLIEKVAAHGAPVLIEGETGTGKELVARAIHAGSSRRAGPFVAEATGAMPETLLEAELFGQVKGAFTGATDRRGAFERASGGTLFLDDVSDMPPRMQAMLLRVLETSEVRPLGAPSLRRVDCRVIASSRHDLGELVRRGAFREDLYFRLSVLRLQVPPLRERREDIPALVESFLREMGRAPSSLTPAALEALVAADWPGNVRELKHALERASVLAGPGAIEPEHLAGEQRPVEPAPAPLATASKVAVGGKVLSKRQLVLVEYLRRHHVATTRDYVELTSVSLATAWRDLNDLVEKGVIRPEGQGRGTTYRLA